MALLCHGCGTDGGLLPVIHKAMLDADWDLKQEPKGGRMILCRKCRWLGMTEDLKWGSCPGCGGRKFADNVELWAERLGWAMFVTFLGYLVTQGPLTIWMR